MNKEYLADRALKIKPSPSAAANARVAQLRADGRDIVNLTIGEPDFNTPAHIVDAAIKAIQEGDTHYTPTPGTEALRKAIQFKLKRDNGLHYSLAEIVVGCGGKHIIQHALAATLNEGDEVIIPAPYWVSYPDMTILNDGIPVIVLGDLGNELKITADALALAITPRTKWVILNSPNNPTGAVYNAAELTAIAEVLVAHPHVMIMADEIYEHFIFDNEQHISFTRVAPYLKDRTLIVNGASKGYAMTGWRIGFAAGPLPLINSIIKLLSQTTSCPSSISQAAAVAAFAGDQEPVLQMAQSYEHRRKVMVELLATVPQIAFDVPKGAFYIYADVTEVIGRKTPAGAFLESDTDVVSYLIEEGGVATVAGVAFGMSPYIRISFAGSEESIREGCIRIKDSLARLA